MSILSSSKHAAVVMPPVLISVDEFGALGGVKRTKAYELLKRPDAPKPVVLGPKTVHYRYAECVRFWESLPTSETAEPAALKSRRYKSGLLISEASDDGY